jgi:D-alanyl-D-alanine dipeptidase
VTGADHVGRIGRVLEAAAERGADALVLTPSPDTAYLVGHAPRETERPTLLVLRPGEEPVLVVPALEAPLAEASPAGGLAALRLWRDGEDPFAPAAAALGGATRIAVGDRAWAVHLLGLQVAMPDATFVPAGPTLARVRSVKDASELDALRRAGAAADATFEELRSHGFAGRTELEVAADVARLLIEHGHDRADFTIVASGPNGASPHHEPGDRRIVPGDAVVLDFGGVLDAYCSDTTRTVVVEEPPDGFDDAYDLVRRAQQAAFDAVRPGVPAEEVDRAARAVIEAGGLGEAFVHRTGHGIGLEVHEAPYLVAGNDEPLRPGMTSSIEPGVYLPGRFGVRIEDIVAVTDDGAERLNRSTRELQTVA